MHTAAVRSSALGTRIAAVAPPPFSAVPETTHVPLASEERRWNWNQTDTAGTAKVKTAGAKKKVKSTRPASAPLRRRTGGGIANNGEDDGGASARGCQPRQLKKSRRQKKAVAWDGIDVSGASGMVARHVLPGKVEKHCLRWVVGTNRVNYVAGGGGQISNRKYTCAAR